jgi:hypothetical protein
VNKSAKGAARTTERARNCFAPALRFARVPQKRKGCGAHHRTGQELLRARAPFCASSLEVGSQKWRGIGILHLGVTRHTTSRKGRSQNYPAVCALKPAARKVFQSLGLKPALKCRRSTWSPNDCLETTNSTMHPASNRHASRSGLCTTQEERRVVTRISGDQTSPRSHARSPADQCRG